MGVKEMIKQAREGWIKGIPEHVLRMKEIRCRGCIIGKQKKRNYSGNITDGIDRRLQCMMTDNKGPIRVETKKGYRHLQVFVDAYTGWTAGFLLKKRREVYESVERIRTVAEGKAKDGERIQRIHADNAQEFKSKRMARKCKKMGINLTYTSARTPENNGLAERTIQSITNIARTMLIESNLAAWYWGHAMLYAITTYNHGKARKQEMTKEEAMTGRRPNGRKLYEFGQKGHVKEVRGTEEEAFQNRSHEDMWCMIGMSESIPGAYIMLNNETGEIRVTREVIFTSKWKGEEEKEPEREEGEEQVRTIFEDIPEEARVRVEEEEEKGREKETEEERNERAKKIEEIFREVREEKEEREKKKEKEREEREKKKRIEEGTTMKEKEVRKSTRERRRTAKAKEWEESTRRCNHVRRIGKGEIPKTYRQAIEGEEKEKWKESMEKELKSLKDFDVWETCQLPKGRSAIGSKWCYDIKKADGRYKSRAVAKGYNMKKGIDYEETYSGVAKFDSVRLLLAILGGHRGWEMGSADFANAFLNARVKEEEIYMDILPGSEEEERVRRGELPEGTVLRLKVYLYGTKQAARKWEEKAKNDIEEIGFAPLKSDPCVYVKREGNQLLYILIWVDDIMMIGDGDLMTSTMNKLQEKYKMTIHRRKEEEKRWEMEFLGMRITHNMEDGSVEVDAKKKIEAMGVKYLEEHRRRREIPQNPRRKIEKKKEEEEELNEGRRKLYLSLVMSIHYVARTTRPDICYTTVKLCEQALHPTEEHWDMLQECLAYLVTTKEMSIRYEYKGGRSVWATLSYTDSSYADIPEDRTSTAGNLHMMNGGLLTGLKK